MGYNGNWGTNPDMTKQWGKWPPTQGGSPYMGGPAGGQNSGGMGSKPPNSPPPGSDPAEPVPPMPPRPGQRPGNGNLRPGMRPGNSWPGQNPPPNQPPPQNPPTRGPQLGGRATPFTRPDGTTVWFWNGRVYTYDPTAGGGGNPLINDTEPGNPFAPPWDPGQAS